PRFFRRLAEGVFDLEDLRKRTNELADFVAASLNITDSPATTSLPLVIQTAPTSLRACCCSGQKSCAAQFCFGPWFRWFRKISRIFHQCTFGSVPGVRIQSFQHPRLDVLSNFFVARARM